MNGDLPVLNFIVTVQMARTCSTYSFIISAETVTDLTSGWQIFKHLLEVCSPGPLCVSHTMQARPTLSMSPSLNSSSIYGNVYIWKTQIEIYPLHLFLDQCLICYYRLLHGAYSQSPYS